MFKIEEIKVSYNPNYYDNLVIKNSELVHTIFSDNWDDEIGFAESFYILLLSRSNQVIGIKKVGQGSISGCVIPIREILAIALKCNAVGIITCHNHPSGNLKPSEADKKVWKRLNEACIIMGLENLDNLIITPNKEYYSQVDDRLLL
tara:strand:- start:7054 stop:7494 length:441 start_codon:yes stop_codon:yes gene_type:complete